MTEETHEIQVPIDIGEAETNPADLRRCPSCSTQDSVRIRHEAGWWPQILCLECGYTTQGRTVGDAVHMWRRAVQGRRT